MSITCPICLEDTQAHFVLPCKHGICVGCVGQFFRMEEQKIRGPRCPCCRAECKRHEAEFVGEALGNTPKKLLCRVKGCRRKQLDDEGRCLKCSHQYYKTRTVEMKQEIISLREQLARSTPSEADINLERSMRILERASNQISMLNDQLAFR